MTKPTLVAELVLKTLDEDHVIYSNGFGTTVALARDKYENQGWPMRVIVIIPDGGFHQ